jgi:RHH-type proline utilization regulon transcriptional repressor/proline dehydrogenase/delta 1-pyrroline-5-carboxylate dehydrogenase
LKNCWPASSLIQNRNIRISGEGRLEMLWHLREQSISTDYRRYGNLGIRAIETRAEVL